MEGNLQEWMEIGKWAIASGLFGYLARTVIYIWKERKEGKKEARSNYQEAIAIAAKNRDAAHDGLLLLRQTIQRIQASPRSGEFSTARQHFEKAADSIAEPNVKSAQEFYDSLYQYDKEMPVLYSRKILKKARHFLANNEGAYRSMNKQLEILGTTLDLQLGPHESK